jgi:AraC-like DNA-binding protein
VSSLALLLCGYSAFSALLLAATHFRSEVYAEKPLERGLGVALVMALGGLQVFHFFYLSGQPEGVRSGTYQALLFTIAPLFYLFSQPLITALRGYSLVQALHFVPLLCSPWLPADVAWPAAFSLGAGYLAAIARQVYALRAFRQRFQLELGLLLGVFLLGVGVVALVFLTPLIAEPVFFALYAGAIGAAFLLVNLALAYAPQMPEHIAEAARETYVSSTLANIDCDAMTLRLDDLMRRARIYENPDLDLTDTAQQLGLSPHQLSELVNTRLGKGFSRYVREFRVAAAQEMLLKEPDTSVLAVGLNTGFSSQSNFYTAFREVTGMTPGQFRKISLPVSPE